MGSSYFLDDRCVANPYGLNHVLATKVESYSTRSVASENFYVFPTFFNNNTCSISIRIGCVLDCEQHTNYCAAMGNYERNESKDGLDN